MLFFRISASIVVPVAPTTAIEFPTAEVIVFPSPAPVPPKMTLNVEPLVFSMNCVACPPSAKF